MDIGFKPESWGRGPSGGIESRLDWQGLRARFLAGHAMRRAFGTPGRPTVPSGSFDDESARILNGYGVAPPERLPPVNSTASGDGNAPGGTNQPVTGKKRPAIEE